MPEVCRSKLSTVMASMKWGSGFPSFQWTDRFPITVLLYSCHRRVETDKNLQFMNHPRSVSHRCGRYLLGVKLAKFAASSGLPLPWYFATCG